MSKAVQNRGTWRYVAVGLGITAVLITVAALTEPDAAGGGKAEAAVQATLPLHFTNHVLTVSSSGVVQASHMTLLSPGVSGRVDQVNPRFSPGEVIPQGTPLVELEKFEYRAKLAQAQADLEQARMDVATEQAEALKAVKKTYSAVSRNGAESELVLRVPQRRAVNARLTAAEEYVEEAEQALRDTVLAAPYVCRVVECSVGQGARVVAGQAVGKVIPLDERIIRVPVSLEEFAALARNGREHKGILLTAFHQLKNGTRLQWRGVVQSVDSSLDAASNKAVLIAALEPSETHMEAWKTAPVNMTLQVEVNINVPDSDWIPASAVRDGRMVRVNTPSGVQERAVHVEAEQDGRALVTMPDFCAGDTLVL